MGSFPVERKKFFQNNFDLLRFLLATLVIFSHCWGITQGSDANEPLFRLTNGRLTMGQTAVCSFFAISGFLVAHSWASSPSARKFLKKRAARIYPGFVVCTFICLFVIRLAWDGTVGFPWPEMIRQAVTHSLVFGVPEAHHAFAANPFPHVNSAMWTVRYEFMCYLCLAGLGVMGVLARPRAVAALFVFVLVVYWTLITTQTWISYSVRVTQASRGAAFFLAGVVFYLFRGHIPRSARLAAVGVLVLASSLMFSAAFPIFLPIVGVYLLFFAAYAPIGAEHFGRYGDFSYGIYLYGMLIQQSVVANFGTGIGIVRLFVFAAALAVIAGALSWHLVEKHFLPRASKKSTSHPESRKDLPVSSHKVFANEHPAVALPAQQE